MERLYEIGDIVYSKKQGPCSQFEVVGIYPLETEERHFRLRRITDFDPFDMNHKAERFYCTEYFYHMSWVATREVLTEKC
mgnify:FL=1